MVRRVVQRDVKPANPPALGTAGAWMRAEGLSELEMVLRYPGLTIESEQRRVVEDGLATRDGDRFVVTPVGQAWLAAHRRPA